MRELEWRLVEMTKNNRDGSDRTQRRRREELRTFGEAARTRRATVTSSARSSWAAGTSTPWLNGGRRTG